MSNINYVSINENFPVAGQDNDTQVFRDNFDTIKTSLRYAKEELEELQNTSSGAARLNAENNFNKNVIRNATFLGNFEQARVNLDWQANQAEIAYDTASYHVLRLTGAANPSVQLQFVFPEPDPVNPKLQKMIVELYTDVTNNKTVSFFTSGTLTYKKNFAGSTINLLAAQYGNSKRKILEVWQYSANLIFIEDKGDFE